MKTIQRHLFQNPLDLLILFLPLTLAGELLHWPALVVFILTCIGIIPMAAYIGKATESLAHFTSPRVGGLLNATLGNAAELIITITAIRAGLLELVKASITGSILGNLLLVMGFSFVVGGTRHGHQVFDQRNVAAMQSCWCWLYWQCSSRRSSANRSDRKPAQKSKRSAWV